MSLRQKAVTGVKWTGAGTVLTVSLTLLQTSVLARLLTPTEFGIAAMVVVLNGFLVMFGDLGLSNAIVQKQDATDEQLSTLYWLNLATGVSIYGVAILSSPLVAAFYREPRLVEYVRIGSLGFVIGAFGQLFASLAMRDLRFGVIAVADSLSAAATAVVAIVLAANGYGVYSLLFGMVAGVVARTVVLIWNGMRYWRPSRKFEPRGLGPFLRFGAYQTGERASNFFAANVDYLAVGRILGPEALGIYKIAYELVVQPIVRLNPIIVRVAWPVLAKKQNDNEVLRSAYLYIIRAVAYVQFPIIIGMAAVAPLLVSVLYGPNWTASASLVQILAAMALMRVLWNPCGAILLAKGRVDIGFWLTVAQATVAAVIFAVVAHFGLVWVAVSWSVIVWTYAYASWRPIFLNTIGLRGRQFLSTIAMPLAVSACMGVIVWILSFTLAPAPLSRVAKLLLLVCAGAVIYSSLVLIVSRGFVIEMWYVLTGRVARAAHPAA